eukprot:66657-Rhodomonas_salina.3
MPLRSPLPRLSSAGSGGRGYSLPPLVLRRSYAMSGTDLAYRGGTRYNDVIVTPPTKLFSETRAKSNRSRYPNVLRRSYALSGTDLACRATPVRYRHSIRAAIMLHHVRY